MKKKTILFVGNYLSKSRGSKGVVETIIDQIEVNNYEFKLSSKLENKFFRFLDFFWSLFFSSYDRVYVDIYSGQAFLFTKMAVFASKLRKKEITGTLRGGALQEYDKKNGGVVLKTIKKMDKLQSPSKFLIHYFKSNNLAVNYLPNPITLDVFKFDRSKVIKNTILWVRAFDKIYNPSLAIKIIFELKKENPDIQLTMVGPDRGEMSDCMDLISDLNLEKNVSIIGQVPHNKLPLYFQTHEIYINTTSYESFGNALIEAASCGIPIVSTSVGEIPYSWEHEKNIILVNSFDEKIFSSKIKMLLANNELKIDLSINARKKSEQYDINTILPLWKF